jgi:hypothetical protein
MIWITKEEIFEILREIYQIICFTLPIYLKVQFKVLNLQG